MLSWYFRYVYSTGCDKEPPSYNIAESSTETIDPRGCLEGLEALLV